MHEQKDPLVFGDPDQPLTIGVFVRWLEGPFADHTEKEDKNCARVDEIHRATFGNGNVEDGMQYRVRDMWEATKRMNTRMHMGRLLWSAILSIIGVMAGAHAVGISLGWWGG